MIDGCARFLDRVYRLAVPGPDGDDGTARAETGSGDLELRRATHRLIDRVSGGYERWSFNTAVAAAMEFVNLIGAQVREGEGGTTVTAQAVDTLLLLLAPMVPHVTAEAWERRHASHVHEQPWPVADPALLTVERVVMVVQVNGKVRDRIEVPLDISADAAEELALASPAVREALGGSTPTRVVAKPPRIVNVVV
ncbi:MAG: class I tRNA ligase family protein [Acidimicrobiales bacterium]|nr:class I tRNA ligase family protein [Acidimicrobiales bacterium]